MTRSKREAKEQHEKNVDYGLRKTSLRLISTSFRDNKKLLSMLPLVVVFPKRGSSKSHNPSDGGSIKMYWQLVSSYNDNPSCFCCKLCAEGGWLTLEAQTCCRCEAMWYIIVGKKKTESNLHKITPPAGECTSEIISSFYPSVFLLRANTNCELRTPHWSQLNKA